MVLTLQKLVHLHADQDDSDSDSEDGSVKKRKRGPFSKVMRKFFSTSKPKEQYDDKQRRASMVAGVHDTTKDYVTGHTDGVKDAPKQKLRTLQRYHGGPNQERMAYMEKHSALTRNRLAVSAEQVSISFTNGMLNPKLRYVRYAFVLLLDLVLQSLTHVGRFLGIQGFYSFAPFF